MSLLDLLLPLSYVGAVFASFLLVGMTVAYTRYTGQTVSEPLWTKTVYLVSGSIPLAVLIGSFIGVSTTVLGVFSMWLLSTVALLYTSFYSNSVLLSLHPHTDTDTNTQTVMYVWPFTLLCSYLIFHSVGTSLKTNMTYIQTPYTNPVFIVFLLTFFFGAGIVTTMYYSINILPRN